MYNVVYKVFVNMSNKYTLYFLNPRGETGYIIFDDKSVPSFIHGPHTIISRDSNSEALDSDSDLEEMFSQYCIHEDSHTSVRKG